MNTLSASTGPALASALTEAPLLTLNFYTYGVTLRKTCDGITHEHPVDPAHIAAALAAKVTFDTGLLSEHTLLVRQDGVKKTVVEYRPPGKTGIFLDDQETALRVPLPPLILIRVTSDGQPHYALYAVKKRPTDLTAPLFHAPLPNVFSSGAICWGTVPRADGQSASLAADWGQILGSPFGNHACSGKSKRHPSDIRQQLIALDAAKARRYPVSDLLPVNKTLAHVLGDAS